MATAVIKDLPLKGWTDLLGSVVVMTAGRRGRYWHLACESQLCIFQYTGQFLTVRNYSAPYSSFECLIRHSCMTYSSSVRMYVFILSISTICKLFCALSLFQWRYFVFTVQIVLTSAKHKNKQKTPLVSLVFTLSTHAPAFTRSPIPFLEAHTGSW